MPMPRQQGAALIVALLLLTVLTLLGISSVNNSTVNLRVTANLQAYQEAEAAAQDAIEQVISSVDVFNAPVENEFVVDGIDVVVDVPVCLLIRNAEGYSATFALAPKDTQWDIRATATDSITGARAVVNQGIAVAKSNDICP